jgi:hypothetical protein
MNWFRENRSLALFFVLSGAGIFGAVGLLFMAKNDSDEASRRFSNTATEWNRSGAALALSKRREPSSHRYLPRSK